MHALKFMARLAEIKYPTIVVTESVVNDRLVITLVRYSLKWQMGQHRRFHLQFETLNLNWYIRLWSDLKIWIGAYRDFLKTEINIRSCMRIWWHMHL